MILSFDLGVKNLSFCLLDRECHIHEWEVVNILENRTKTKRVKYITIEKCVTYLVDYLLQKKWDNITTVLIEAQPGGGRSGNLRMKTLSHAIQTFFHMNGVEVKFISPKRKLELCGGACKDKSSKVRYQEHKRRAIVTADEIVKDTKWSKFFRSLKKRDDAADSLLQGIWYIRQCVPRNCTEKNDI